MNARDWLRGVIPGLVIVILGIGAAVPANATTSEDPLFVYVPVKPTFPVPGVPVLPPPLGYFTGPCGVGTDPLGNFYVSDYYHHVIDAFKPDDPSYKTNSSTATGYLGQLSEVDEPDGPCGLAFDGNGNLYVNDYHRKVAKYGPTDNGTVVTGVGVDSNHPTGVAVDPVTGYVYVDARDHVDVFDEDGAAVSQGLATTLEDGYGIAVSQYPGTAGHIYVPDAISNTVKIYDPSVDTSNPIGEISAGDTPRGKFVSLRDAVIAVDRVSGDVYVVDNIQPEYTYQPFAEIFVFNAANQYKGRLKYRVVDALPVGLTVDNGPGATYPGGTQGRVYVTSGNTIQAGVYAYPPGAASTATPRNPSAGLILNARGTGGGAIRSDLGSLNCSARCEGDIRAGAVITLTAEASPGSEFTGWSGACSGDGETCEVRMDQAKTVNAEFQQIPVEAAATESIAPAPVSSSRTAVISPSKHHRPHRHGGRRHKPRKSPHHRRRGGQ